MIWLGLYFFSGTLHAVAFFVLYACSLFFFFSGGTSNGNADASHSDSGDSHLSPPSKLKKCSVCISPVVFYSPHTHLFVCRFFIFCVDLFFLLPQKFSSQFNIAKMVKLIGRLTGPQKDTVTSIPQMKISN